MAEKDTLVPYDLVTPGWEGMYTGEILDAPDDSTDAEGNCFAKWSTWPFADCGADWCEWGDEAQYVNQMQEMLGDLSNEVR